MTDVRYVAISKLSRSLVHKENFRQGKLFLSQDTYFVKRGRIPPLSLNELGGRSEATMTLGKFVNKP